MLTTYESFTDFIERAVLPLKREHPDWMRLDGRDGGGNPSAFAVLKEDGRLYRVHSDSKIESLLAPYEALKSGKVTKAVEAGVSNRGKEKLVPCKGAGSEAGFYIYLQPVS